MEFEAYATSLNITGLGVCLGISILILKKHKSLGALLILIGFAIITVSQFSINHCTAAFALGLDINKYTITCNPAMPYLSLIGFGILATGLGMYSKVIKQSA